MESVQSLLGIGNNQSHTMTYAAGLIQCGHCGHQITGELKTKKTKTAIARTCTTSVRTIAPKAIRKLG